MSFIALPSINAERGEYIGPTSDGGTLYLDYEDDQLGNGDVIVIGGNAKFIPLTQYNRAHYEYALLVSRMALTTFSQSDAERKDNGYLITFPICKIE